METEPIELTNEEQAELRQLRQIIYDNADAPNLTPEQWKRLVYLQNKEYRYEKAQAVRYQNETEDEIARLQNDNLKLADDLEQAENQRQTRTRRRINFGEEDNDETFDPPRTSSRLGRRFRLLDPPDEDAISKLQDMTLDDIAKMPNPDAKRLLESLPNDSTTNAIRLAAKVMAHQAETNKTIKRSNDFVPAPLTAGTKTDIDPKTDKYIKILFGADTKYNSPTDRTLTMRELLTKHSEVTTKFDLDTITSIRVLKVYSGGFLRETLTRMEREHYSLEVIYSILQTSYQDSPTVSEARRSLEAVMARADQNTNIYLLVTNLIKISYDLYQFSPATVRQLEAITNTTTNLFSYLFKCYDRKQVSQLQDVFNTFRDTHGGNISETDLWNFVSRVEYFCTFEARPIRGGEHTKTFPAKHHTGRVNSIRPDFEEPLWQLEEHEEPYETQDFPEADYVQDLVAHRPSNDQSNSRPGYRPQPPLRPANPYQPRPNPNYGPQRPSQTTRPQQGFNPPKPQLWASNQRRTTYQNAQQRQDRPAPQYSSNPQDYGDTVKCRLCQGNSKIHAPPFHRYCTIFPRELPTGIPCPKCKGEHRLDANNICKNPVMSARVQDIVEFPQHDQYLEDNFDSTDWGFNSTDHPPYD